MATKRVNISIDEALYNQVVELSKNERRTPANFLGLFVENNLKYMLANMAGQQQFQLTPKAE